METIGNPWLWGIFACVVGTALAVDLFVVGGGRRHAVSAREAGRWTLVWVSLAMLFALGLWFWLDQTVGRTVANTKVMEFLTGYLIEESLSVDNVFVWMMLFSTFAVPADLQRRVLLYGVLGAILMRTLVIFGGTWLVQQLHVLLYFFGAFLLYTGFRMLRSDDHPVDPAQMPLVRWLRARVRMTDGYRGEAFLVREPGQDGRLAWHATPLLLALVAVELSDVLFAVDSIPAILAVTTDPFIVLTSNVFAIMGLRSLYFLVADAGTRFSLLRYGLSLVLIFIGIKMLIMDIWKIPVMLSLAVVASLLLGSILLSLHRARRS